ncbi:hypothetical protein TNCV_2735861 [Trichonephila clavipes]|nr:hypothetical protein TNCV_2735861 [Trichonephila clavipes]
MKPGVTTSSRKSVSRQWKLTENLKTQSSAVIQKGDVDGPMARRFQSDDEKIPEASALANKVTNDAKMVAKVAKLAANLVSKIDGNLALPPRFRQVLIESPL